MRIPTLLLVLLLLAGGLVPAGAQSTQAGERPWRLNAGGTVYHVDDLAGTPIGPSIGLSRELGRRGLVGLDFTWINDAGFYGLTALAADLDLGLRERLGRLELQASVGPSGLLGGDGDGTPYYSAGAHASAGLVYWPSDHLGVYGRGRLRQWITSSPANRSPGLSAGLVLRF